MAMAGTYAFCTLISPPDGVEAGELTLVLANEGLSDVPTVRMALTRVPPLILGQATPELSSRLAGVIVGMGGDAMSVTMDDIQKLGGTMRVRDIRVHPGALELELWRGPTAMVRNERIQVLVRAHSSSEQSTGRMGEAQVRATNQLKVYGRGFGLIGGPDMREEHDARRAETRVVSKDWLDIHTSDGSVFQVDGDKFGFQVLGENRTQGDRHNMDRLFEMLRHLAPDAVADTYFPQFKPPAGVKRLRLPGMAINAEDPSFAFYSRWAALVYRHVMGG